MKKDTKKSAESKSSGEKKTSKKEANSVPGTVSNNDTVLKNYNTAVSYHKKKDFKNAIMYYNAAIKKDRKYWQAWLGLGTCYYSMSKFRNAKLIFQYVLTIKPGEPTARKYYDIMTKPKKTKAAALPETRSKGDLMWRSAMMPGLGQFYNGELAKGYIYSIGYMVGVACIVKYTLDQNNAVAAYNNANTGFDEKYRAAQDATNRIFIPVAATVVVWSVSVLDAFLSGKDDAPDRIIRKAEVLYDGAAVTARIPLLRSSF
ncbi:MAG: hypothetical protein LLG37_10620 [Spirochaetia bacterium]|nr:hypothetical protein [Spirochaetia bacterium]